MPDGFHEGPPREYLPSSRLGPLGAYGGPAGYQLLDDDAPDTQRVGVLERDVMKEGRWAK
ncbi:MAG TPA: hypothetical protein VM223_26875 [Planctomycetota bacterium]|nr:hypothetical protein [Planctomycetota bacterium]